jgi:hypothetical protein
MQAIGLDHEPAPLRLHSRWSETYRLLPKPLELSQFGDLLATTKADVLLPMASWVARVVSRDREHLERQVAVNVPQFAAFEAAYDKRRTLEECHALGIPAPRLLAPGESAEAVVVKPSVDVGAALGVAICRDPMETDRAVRVCRQYGEPLVQEYIPGPTDSMRTVVLLFDRNAQLIAHFTTRKLQTRPITGGVTTLSVSTDDRALLRQVMPFFEEWRWRGPAEVELKIDPRDRRAKVIEINPRFPGYIGFAVQCGLHLPRYAVLAALGEVIKPPPYAVGRRYLNPMLHLKAVLDELRESPDRMATLRRAIHESRGAPWINWAEFSDPAPKLGKILAELRAAWSGVGYGMDGVARVQRRPDEGG